MLLLTLFPQPVLSILHYVYLILWDAAKMQPSEFLKVKVAQSCPTLCDPMDYIVHGILQARILEWVNFPFSRGSSQTRDRTQVSCIAGRVFTSEPQGKTKNTGVGSLSLLQQIFPTQESNKVTWIAGRFFTNWASVTPFPSICFCLITALLLFCLSCQHLHRSCPQVPSLLRANGVLFHLFHMASNTMPYTEWICEAGCQEGSRKVPWKCAL